MNTTLASAELGDQGRTDFVTVGGQRLRVVTQGSGSPLLLITGLGANIEMWRPLMRLLVGRQVIAFDPPGAGRSPAGPPRRMPDHARLVRDLLDELELARVDILGYSWGASLAQQLAHDHPERVRRLILAGGMCGLGSVPASPLVLMHLLHPLRYYSATYLRWVTPTIYAGRTAREQSAMDAQVRAREANPPSVVGYAMQLFAITGWTSLPWLHRIQAPTLVLGGAQDPIVRTSNARLLASRIPDAELRVLDGAGHLFLFDQPEETIELLERFLADE
jgi:poly(3-hydroxyalkanoate) depolymerase